AEFTIGEGELMAHDVPLGCAPDEYDGSHIRNLFAPSLTEDTLRLLEKIAPSAHKIGASSAIEALHRQVASGLNEAQLMRDFVADGGSLIGLVKKHCEIWAGD
ncbi:hypothetical protein P0228_22980, partial [Escherichia coli]